MDESPIYSRTPRKSRYSSYQSDYETAGEDSDSSLYYSTVEDDSPNKENSMIPPNGAAGRYSLLEKCLQKNFNLTPRNEFNKRATFNVNPFLPSNHSPTTGFGSQIIKSLKTEDEATETSERTSINAQTPTSSITENIADYGTMDGSSDVIEAADQSLNSTIVAADLPEVESEATIDVAANLPEVEPEATIDVSEDVPISKFEALSTSTSTFDVKTVNNPEGT